MVGGGLGQGQAKTRARGEATLWGTTAQIGATPPRCAPLPAQREDAARRPVVPRSRSTPSPAYPSFPPLLAPSLSPSRPVEPAPPTLANCPSCQDVPAMHGARRTRVPIAANPGARAVGQVRGPGAAEGVRGMAFIENVIASGKSGEKWFEFKV